jgi:hypothetical protein
MLNTFSSSLFSVSNDDGRLTLSTDMSDLGHRAFYVSSNKYAQSKGGIGFRIKSTRTGKLVSYFEADEVRDREGEVTHWVLRPSRESILEVPECMNTQVFVFND